MYTLFYFYDWVKVIFLGIEKDFANHSLVFFLLEPMFKFFYLTSSLFLFTELYTCIILLFGIFCIFSMCCRNYSSSCSPSRSYSHSVSRSRSRRRESRSPSIRRRKGSPSHLDKRRITRWGGGYIVCLSTHISINRWHNEDFKNI